MTEKIIFLDIDGPMIPTTMYLIDKMCSFERKFPVTTVAVLNRICKETEAKIVFNSTHNRSWVNVPDIELALVAHGLDPSYIRQEDFKTKYPDLARDIAVKEWLHRHPEVTNWVAIDDVKFTDSENLIWVDPDAGLHVGHLNKAISILGGKQVIILM